MRAQTRPGIRTFFLITFNEDGEESLLYIAQNKASLDMYEEEALGIITTNDVAFQKDNPPSIVEIEEEAYYLTQHKIGEKFISGVSPSIEIQQWLYLSKDKKEHIRIVDNEDLITFSKGIKRKESDFENSLDLHDLPPMQEIRYDEPNWTDEDLV